jgi:hypothetical protein
MSTTATHYVMFALRLPRDVYKMTWEDAAAAATLLDKLEDDGSKTQVTHVNGLTSVSDGNGQYVFLGKVLAKGLGHEGLPVVCCQPEEPAHRLSLGLLGTLKELLGKRFDLLHPALQQYLAEHPAEADEYFWQFKVWAFTHWH